MTAIPSAHTIRIALIGNPNTGKSTLFNRLTGLRQRTANYPGITVEKKVGAMDLDGRTVELIDLPGTYSLSAVSPDERVVMDVLGGRGGYRPPDLILCVVDAANLQRNLVLVSQVSELGIPMVVALNQWDAAARNGINIDTDILEERLGVPVVPTVAKKGQGIQELKGVLASSLSSPRRAARVVWPGFVVDACRLVRETVSSWGKDVTQAEAMRMVFDGEASMADRIGRRAELSELLQKARGIIFSAGMNPGSAEAVIHYRHLDRLLEGVELKGSSIARKRDPIDKLLLNRFWGTLIFVGVMYVVFQSLYAWAGPLMDLIDAGTGWLQEAVSPMLGNYPAVQSLVSDGIIAGAGGVLIFLPQILLLFLFISILESTGYLARAAFLMDKLLGWCGLNGKSFVPLLSGYACAIPGIMAARTIEDPKARLATILMVPFMSCSARLPVYVLLIGAFVEPAYGPMVAGWTLFLMHFVGAIVVMPLAWFVNRVILRTKVQPFILEMPEYRVPALRDVFLRMWGAGREFVVRAGTVILAFSVIIWALLYFPRPASVEEEIRTQVASSPEVAAALDDGESDASLALAHRADAAYVEQSYLGRFGKFVQPAFDPAGFDWKITVGVLSSFPAREVIIATLGIIYSLGGDIDEESGQLRDVLAREKWQDGPRKGQPVYTLPTVAAIMVFFALCLQCGATVAVVAKELDWKWAIGLFCAMTMLAWLAAVLVYQTGTHIASVSG